MKYRTMCLTCQKSTPYHIITKKVTTEYYNIKFSYNRYYAICNICGKEVWDGTVDDLNVHNAYQAYLQAKNLL